MDIYLFYKYFSGKNWRILLICNGIMKKLFNFPFKHARRKHVALILRQFISNIINFQSTWFGILHE